MLFSALFIEYIYVVSKCPRPALFSVNASLPINTKDVKAVHLPNRHHIIQTSEHKSFRKILRISFMEHKAKAYVRDKINTYAGKQEQLILVVKRRKLPWWVM
jgi:hypothetical protein